MNEKKGKSPVFEKTYRDYLAQIAELDFNVIAEKLLIQANQDQLIIPFFGKPYRVSANNIIDPSGSRPDHSVSVLLSKYLLLCPKNHPKENDWVSYRDFKDAAPFAGAFVINVERPIAKHFSGRIADLGKACKSIGGSQQDIEISYELCMRFDALPKIPILLLFNDTDEEFPAQCKILFERRAEKYLDMECLAIVGMLLSHYLKNA